jgi:hypothetical protein
VKSAQRITLKWIDEPIVDSGKQESFPREFFLPDEEFPRSKKHKYHRGTIHAMVAPVPTKFSLPTAVPDALRPA